MHDVHVDSAILRQFCTLPHARWRPSPAAISCASRCGILVPCR